jgi:hypothetical protein
VSEDLAYRRRWHPLTLALSLTALSVVACWLLPAAWLLMGAVAGFALSGST